MERLVIVGAGGLGREVAHLVETIRAKGAVQWTLAGFIDDDPELHGASILGYPVVGGIEVVETPGASVEADAYAIAVGNARVRRHLADTMARSALQPATLIHPTVEVHRSVHIGPGSIICKGVALTVNIHIGPHVIVNLNSTIGHDATVEGFATLHPGTHLSGNTCVGEACEVGTGAVALPGIGLGAGARVGAGAVVTKDIPPGTTVAGVPARPMSS